MAKYKTILATWEKDFKEEAQYKRYWRAVQDGNFDILITPKTKKLTKHGRSLFYRFIHDLMSRKDMNQNALELFDKFIARFVSDEKFHTDTEICSDLIDYITRSRNMTGFEKFTSAQEAKLIATMKIPEIELRLFAFGYLWLKHNKITAKNKFLTPNDFLSWVEAAKEIVAPKEETLELIFEEYLNSHKTINPQELEDLHFKMFELFGNPNFLSETTKSTFLF